MAARGAPWTLVVQDNAACAVPVEPAGTRETERSHMAVPRPVRVGSRPSHSHPAARFLRDGPRDAEVRTRHGGNGIWAMLPLTIHILVTFFLFYIFKKQKFQKYMSVLKYFKNIPRSPPHRATDLKCNFFFKFAMRSLEMKKRTCRPAHGRPPLGPAHGRGRGPVAPPPRGRPGYPPYKSSSPPLPSSFEPENSTKNPEKKRGVRRRKAAKPCRIQHL